jgi:hypothetical protein
MLTYFLFLFYLTIGILLLHVVVRRQGFGFSIYHTTAIVCFKVLLGILYGYIFLHYYGGDDTWDFFVKSRAETDILLKNPLLFIREFTPSFSLKLQHKNYWAALTFYIHHFEPWFMIKFLAILNLFSGKNYYVDLLWFDLLTIAGPLLLYKMLVRKFPANTGMYYLLVFFIPSITFWLSGIRREAMIFLFLCMILYNGEAYTRNPKLRHLGGMVLGLMGFALFRYQFLIIFLPALAAWLYSHHTKTATAIYFNRLYLFCLLIFTATLFLAPPYQLSRPLIQTQQKFFALHGNTRYMLDSLKPGPVSLLTVFPQALANSSLRPYPWEGTGILQSLSSVESLFIYAGLVFFCFRFPRKKTVEDPLLWLFLFYGITQLIAIGYTVPFPGAIVRYRTIPFLFIFIFLFSANSLLQQKLTSILFRKTLNKKII